MTKLNWNRARKQKPDLYSFYSIGTRLGESAAARVIARLGPPKPGIPADRDGVWIVSHATGKRIVHHFDTLREAHKAGFTWAI